MERPDPLVAVVATGGTIASMPGSSGASTPTLTVDQLLARSPRNTVRVRSIDLMSKDSACLTLADMQRLSDAVQQQLEDPDVAGVVVIHGTDAMEETALLVDLQHADTRPVVFTGAQFTADRPDADGPANLAAAVNAAADPKNGARGVLVAFGGRLLPVWGVYKHSTQEPDAFRLARSDAQVGRPHLLAPVADVRIDIVSVHPGCDAAHLRASLDAGADGIVLAALGSGNATPTLVDAVRHCTAAGVPVIVSTRVPEGALTASYGGGGGGHDLQQAGATHSRTLRPGQARILLAALVAASSPAEEIACAFQDRSTERVASRASTGTP